MGFLPMKPFHHPRILTLLALLATGALVSSWASEIKWRSGSTAPHQTSTGAALTGNYVFELGAFTVGFDPSMNPPNSWAAEWHAATRVLFDASLGAFLGEKYRVPSNAAPFSQTNQGYIWGYNSDGTSAEWILLSDPSWTWPQAGGVDFPVTWQTATASQVIVGTIGDTGDSFHLRTAAVTGDPPATGPQAWLSDVFTPTQQADSTISAWDADPDGDGYCNQTEYALGGNPLTTDSTLDLTASQVSGTTFSVVLNRLATRLATTSLEVSTDLSGWLGIDSRMVVVEDGLDRLEIQFDATDFDQVFLRIEGELLNLP